MPGSQVYWHLCRSNSVVVKLFLDKGADPNMGRDLMGTPLMIRAGSARPTAAEGDEGRVAQLLISAGADIDYIHNDRPLTTALMLTAVSGSMKVAQTLLESGASLTARDTNGMSVLRYAAQGHHEAMVRLIINYIRQGKAPGTTVHAELDWRTPGDETPLMLALCGAMDCPFGVVAALLEHGVGSRQGHPTVVGSYPDAIQLAIGTYSLPIFRAVFKFCCPDENERWNSLGKTALPLAVALNQEDVVQYLLRKGANADGPAHRSGFKLGTPLHIAISEGYVEVVKVLLAHGTDVELVLQLQPNLIQDIQGTEGAKEMTELLVSRMCGGLLATYGPRKLRKRQKRCS